MKKIGSNGTARVPTRTMSRDAIDRVFSSVGQKLRDGRSAEAEKLLRSAVQSYRHTPDDLANLRRLLSFTFETTGRYKESLEAITDYTEETTVAELSPPTRIRVSTQLAIAYSNAGEQPKAVTLLKDTLKKAETGDLTPLSGTIDIALARVYRKLSEYPISRDYAEKSLNYFRADGNWLGMAEAYREIANSLHQEGNSEKALEYFDLGIKIIGNNSAPFML
ncbi:MAG: tetratricopeptide repeat protein, partial [Pyrinomonadaceae bacterium]